MFKIHINDGTQPIPDDDICYIIAKEGIFLKKNMGIMDSIAPVDNISILESVKATAKMNIKKIPGGQFARVIAFFSEVYKKYRGESIVLLFYDEIKRVYKIIPPHQKVTAAACDYDKGITLEGMQMIGTIHSHANMSAFHSGVDDADEEHFDGLHITIGNLQDDEVSITASIVVNGHRFVVQPEEYVERLEKTLDIDETEQKPSRRIFKWIAGKMVEDTTASKQYSYSYRRLDKRYKVNVSDKYHRVIPSWMNMVEKGSYVYNYANMHTQCGMWDGWGGNYDATLWDQAMRPLQLPDTTAKGEKIDPRNVGVKVKPIEFPPHDVEIEDEGPIPCMSCVFRQYKFLMEQEDIDTEPEIYKCEKCESIVIDDDDTASIIECPVCKTSEHLNILLEDELPDNSISSEDVSHLKIESDGVVKDSTFIKCHDCGNGFHLFAGETTCPFCYADIEKSIVNTEETMENQMKLDSGEFLTSEINDIHKAALDEAHMADETIIKRIPDPNENSIPISEKKDTSGIFKRIFRGHKK